MAFIDNEEVGSEGFDDITNQDGATDVAPVAE